MRGPYQHGTLVPFDVDLDERRHVHAHQIVEGPNGNFDCWFTLAFEEHMVDGIQISGESKCARRVRQAALPGDHASRQAV